MTRATSWRPVVLRELSTTYAAMKTISRTLPSSEAWKEKTEIPIERVESPPMLLPIAITTRIEAIMIT